MIDQFSAYNPNEDWFFNDDIEDYTNRPEEEGGAVMELTAEEARKIVKSVNEKLDDPYNDFYEVYEEIRTEAARGKTFVEIEYLRPEEFKILDQAGFKIYTKDGRGQLTKPEAVEGVIPIVIDWE